MKGKKTDTEFISKYIQDCIEQNINTPEEIVKEAQKDIEHIDDLIKHAEKLKIQRSKLLDVVNVFGTNKPDKSEEIRALSFFKLEYPEICQYICSSLKNYPVSVENFSAKYPAMDVVFCIKQLLEVKVIAKSGSHVLRGERYNDYMKIIFKEV